MSLPILYVGMDVHKDSVMIAVLPAAASEPARVERLPNDPKKLQRFFARLARDGEIRACYEASGAGYVLHRALTGCGVACEVVAPSLIPTRPGEQRKHDRRDAIRAERRTQGPAARPTGGRRGARVERLSAACTRSTSASPTKSARSLPSWRLHASSSASCGR